MRQPWAVAAELLKRYAEKLYGYEKRQFVEPRLEVRELTRDDENIPNVNEYIFNINADDETLANHIQSLRTELRAKKEQLVSFGDIDGLNFATHLFSPIFHLRKQGEITIQPLSLNKSEFDFVKDLCDYVKSHKA